MKKIYLALALAVSFTSVSTVNAQSIDIEALAVAEDGANFVPGAGLTLDTAYNAGNADSVKAAVALWLNGPDGMIEGDQFAVLSSFNTYVQPDEPEFEDTVKYLWVTTYTLSQAVEPGNFFFVDLPDSATVNQDDIGLLMDWDLWNNNDSVSLLGKPYDTYENGQEYGFFIQFRESPQFEDADPNNNRSVVRIIWNGSVGISNMIAPKEKVSLNVYPNPTNANLNFKYNLEKTSDVTVIVRDAVGRSVMVKNYGKMNAGNQEFQVDISSLDAGIYTIEMGTSYISALSKFTKL